jgi:hypothetical protein
MESFQYQNKEVKMTPNGSRVNLLNIQNGKGSKSVILYDSAGKVKTNKVKTLKKSEITNIKNKKFMPNLFNDCLRLSKRKTRRSKY